MSKRGEIILAAKCRPEKAILSYIKRAGIKAVELYLTISLVKDWDGIAEVCEGFPFRYALHAPVDGRGFIELAELTKALEAETVIFHNIYWEDEWGDITRVFKNINTKLCIENTYSIHEPLKFMRRYNLGRCLDLEHLQMECAGIYEEEFIKVIKQASHIHLTGYRYGSELWHTHIHHSPEHNLYLLNLLKKSGYSGFVVSEAKASLQTYEEFEGLRDFYKNVS